MIKLIRIALLGIAAILLAVLAWGPIARVLGQQEQTGVRHGRSLRLAAPAEPQDYAAAQAPDTPVSVDGLVWNDLNRDGVQSLKERGLRGVTVNLLNSSKAVVATGLTDANGVYHFEGLAPGDYSIAIVPPAGFVFSPADQGENELVDSDVDPASAESKLTLLAAGENDLVWTAGLYDPTAPVQPEPGTVQPPPSEIDVCAAGVYPLGGPATLRVSQLAPDYCLHAFLWNHAFSIGRIPGGAGRVLAEVTFLEIYYKDAFTYKYEVAGQNESIRVCYAVPAGKQAQIFFFDFYGPRFGERTGKPMWHPLETRVEGGIACAVAQTSGAYALIGK